MPEQDSISSESPRETQIATAPAPPPALLSPSVSDDENEASKESTPMIDVHPAHHAATTWRDFFIHIATICLGLLIAIGLEQTVEAIHHAREHRELIADMRDEAGRNVITLHKTTGILIAEATWFLAARKALQAAAPRAGVVTVTLPPNDPLPFTVTGDRAVWAIAQANGEAALLTEQEAETYHKLDHEAEDADEARQLLFTARTELRAEAASLGLHLSPGSTITVPVAELPGLLKAIAGTAAAMNAWATRLAIWAGAADAVAQGEHGQALIDAMNSESTSINKRIEKEY